MNPIMRAVIFLLIFFIGISASAQPTEGSIHLRSGLSVPLLEYASADLEKGSFTKAGLTTTLALSSDLYKQWGITLQGGLQLHPVDVGWLGYEKVRTDPFLLDVTIRSEPYRILHIAGGPTYSFEPFAKTSVSASLLGGVFYSSTPYQLHKPKYFMTGPDFYEITTSRDYSFAYGAGLSLAYAITDCYHLALESDLLRSKAGFQFVSGAGLRTDWRQITMLNISLSLVLKVPY
jgi:hypothetical protein